MLSVFTNQLDNIPSTDLVSNLLYLSPFKNKH